MLTPARDSGLFQVSDMEVEGACGHWFSTTCIGFEGLPEIIQSVIIFNPF